MSKIVTIFEKFKKKPNIQFFQNIVFL